MVTYAAPARSDVLPGTGRLGLVSAYFAIAAVLAGYGSALFAVALRYPTPGMNLSPHRVAGLVGGLLLTIGYVRIGRLLIARRKSGAQLAVGCFVFHLASYLSGTANLFAVVFALVGLVLVASVWRHLE